MSAASERALGFYPLLEAPHQAPEDYALDVALVKRALECWNIDPVFREHWQADPQRALAERGIELTATDIAPLFVPQQADQLLQAVYRDQDVPEQAPPVRRYCAHLREKLRWRQAHRRENRPSEPRMAAWWERQVARLAGQLGANKADAIVHTPLCFELSEGCSVGCWFCALASQPLKGRVWPASTAHRQLWRELLDGLATRLGSAVGNGFCYWATEPFDNPDYEVFLQDFHAVLGRIPQTTTARPTADLERTRALLHLSERLGGRLNRLSILSRAIGEQVHAAFSPRELLLTELLPQNREANPRFRKARAGRILDHADPGLTQTPTTIACVSGFLINLWAQRIELITPCPASAAWPKGYWTLATAQFASAPEALAQIDRLIAEHMPQFPALDEPARLRPDISLETPADEQLLCHSAMQRITLPRQPQARQLAELLATGTHSPAAIAEVREQAGVACHQTLFLLNHLFDQGVFDEAPSDSQQPATPVALDTVESL